MSPAERKGLWLGLLGVVIFALTLPMTRLAVGTAQAPLMSPTWSVRGYPPTYAAVMITSWCATT